MQKRTIQQPVMMINKLTWLNLLLLSDIQSKYSAEEERLKEEITQQPNNCKYAKLLHEANII